MIRTMYDEFKDLANFKERKRSMIVKYSIFTVEKEIFRDINEVERFQYTISAPGMWKEIANYSYDFYENDHKELLEEVGYQIRNYYEELGNKLEKELLNGHRS